MKVTPVASPHAVATVQTSDSARTAKAVAAFNKAAAASNDAPAQQSPTQPPQSPVRDQNNISVEELGAIQSRQTQAQTTETTDKSIDNTEAQADTAETEVPKQEPKDPALERQFAQLARQERAIRAKAQQERQALKAERDAFQAEKAAFEAQKTPAKPSRMVNLDDYQGDVLGLLEASGHNYEELTQQMIAQQPVDPRLKATVGRMEAKIAQLEQELQNGRKTVQDQQQASYQAAVKQITVDAKNLVKSDPVAFEAISKTGTVKEVVKLIEDTYAKDGVLLSVEEAAQEVENYLIEENYKMANSITKIKQRLAQNVQAAKTGQTQTNKQTQPQMKTLTNATASTRQLSAKERAILAFKGELKS